MITAAKVVSWYMDALEAGKRHGRWLQKLALKNIECLRIKYYRVKTLSNYITKKVRKRKTNIDKLMF